MSHKRSEWRTGESGAYEALRASLNNVIEQLLRDASAHERAQRVDEIAQLRRRVLAVDGFDRVSVDELRAELDGRAHTSTQASG